MQRTYASSVHFSARHDNDFSCDLHNLLLNSISFMFTYMNHSVSFFESKPPSSGIKKYNLKQVTEVT